MRGKVRIAHKRFAEGVFLPSEDEVAVEEPLEIRLRHGERVERVGITLRTPGEDFYLAAGFLYTEGILKAREEVAGMAYCPDPGLPPEARYNVVQVYLRHPIPPFEARRFAVTSACGVCGRGSLEGLRFLGFPPVEPFPVDPSLLLALPEALASSQRLFRATGGLHAAALFDGEGRLVRVFEDVGRHNAMDKLVGWAFLEGRLPLRGHVVLVSGRAGYELVAKAVAAGIPVLCAISAPTSLAVETARAFGLTLVGFLRPGRMNVYVGGAQPH